MSTHKIGFYEDLTKIIFELSSNIIKYAPYFFCWCIHEMSAGDQCIHEMSAGDQCMHEISAGDQCICRNPDRNLGRSGICLGQIRILFWPKFISGQIRIPIWLGRFRISLGQMGIFN